MQEVPLNLTPTRPYFIRAIYEWLSDNQLTPYLLVNAEVKGVEVPRKHVENGTITLNIASYATHNLFMDNDWIRFSARFNGASQDLFIPIAAVMGLFAKENGKGMFFEDSEYTTPSNEVESTTTPAPEKPKKAGLRLLD